MNQTMFPVLPLQLFLNQQTVFLKAFIFLHCTLTGLPDRIFHQIGA